MTKRITGAADVAAPAPRKSGANIPEAQRSTIQLKLRIDGKSRERLEELCDNSGFSLSEQVEALIDCAHADWIAVKERRKAKASKKA